MWTRELLRWLPFWPLLRDLLTRLSLFYKEYLVPLKLRLIWRGVLRGQLHSVRRRCQALLAYDTKHPEVAFLSAAERAQLQAVVDLCSGKLLAKHLK